ncbi:MAG: amidase [Chloroflexota bacterium]|nr:amidase [Chloroflexota bacterium]
MNEILYASAKGISQAIQDKKVSALEVVEAHLRRIEEVNPKLNAVVHLASDRAIAEARKADSAMAKGELTGILHGLPMTVKDSHDAQGLVSTGGTKGRETFVPESDATVVSRMRSEGAIVLGKTNTPELTLAFETDNLIYGRTNNPYDLDRTPGGSSGGAGAIIASGGSPIDLGTDTGGSVRVPSGFCGIAGLKPTSGRVPRTGHIISHSLGAIDSLTTVGPMARFVEDLAMVYPIISGPDWIDPTIVPMALDNPADVDIKQLRVAYFTDIGNTTSHDQIVAVIKSAALALKDRGTCIDADIPSAIAKSPGTSLLAADGGAGVRRLLEKAGTSETHSWVKRFAEGTESLPVGEYTELLEQIDRFRSEMLGFMQKYDAILCPVRPFPALPHGESMKAKYRESNSFTSTFNLTGWPGTVVRAGTSSEGLPIGVQLITRPWREDVALALAFVIEESLGGWKPPNI